MDRIENIDEDRATQLQEFVTTTAGRDEEGLDPLDRTDREHVAYYDAGNGQWLPSALKRGDDVLMGVLTARVLGPAKGRHNFAVYYREHGGENFNTFDVRRVADRAPLDEEEDPMPVIPGLNAPMPEHSLEELRTAAFQQIDQRSDQLIKAGFVHRDTRFSLTLEAQIRYNAMMVLADGLTYPLDINSLDDHTMLSLQSADETRSFCQAALAHVKGVVDSGTAEKERVRGFDEHAELAAFEDSRPEPSP